MKINTKTEIKNFDDKPIKNGDETLTVGYAIASILYNDAKPDDAVRNHFFAGEFFKKKEVELNKSDAELAKKAVERSTYIAGAKGQLIELLSSDK